MKTISDSEIAKRIAAKHELRPSHVRALLKDAFAEVQHDVSKGSRVRTPLGVFMAKHKPAVKGGKKAKNPFTGEEYTTKSKPATSVPKFRPNKGFKEALAHKRR